MIISGLIIMVILHYLVYRAVRYMVSDLHPMAHLYREQKQKQRVEEGKTPIQVLNIALTRLF